MGTPEQRAHRQEYQQSEQRLIDAMTHGQIRSDADLRNWLSAQGMNPDGPMFKRYYSQGGFATYGPSWDPGYNFDFEHNQKIPWQTDPGQTWYDPSVASNWQDTDPLQVARINGFYNWRNTPEGIAAANQYGGNSIAAWYHGRAQSAHPNMPDMRWTGVHYSGLPGGQNGQPLGNVTGGPAGGPVPYGNPGGSPYNMNMSNILGNSTLQGLLQQYTGRQPWANNATPYGATTGLPGILGLAGGGAAWGYIDPSWGGQRYQMQPLGTNTSRTPSRYPGVPIPGVYR